MSTPSRRQSASFTDECLAIRVARRLKSADALRGTPGHIPFRQWSGVPCQSRAGLDRRCRGEDRLYLPGNLSENGFIESFNARLRDELLDSEIFYTIREAEIVTESWWRHYNLQSRISTPICLCL